MGEANADGRASRPFAVPSKVGPCAEDSARLTEAVTRANVPTRPIRPGRLIRLIRSRLTRPGLLIRPSQVTPSSVLTRPSPPEMADPAEPAEPKDPADTAVTEGPAAADGTPDGEADELSGSPGSDAFGAGGSGGAADAWPPPPGAVATISATGTGALRSAARLALRPPAPRRRANWQRVPGVLFAAVTVLPAVLVMAWLIPGLPLLLAGRFAGIPMIVISVPLAVALVVMVLRELPSAWPHGIRDIRDDEPPAESPANQVVVRPDEPPESGDRGRRTSRTSRTRTRHGRSRDRSQDRSRGLKPGQTNSQTGWKPDWAPPGPAGHRERAGLPDSRTGHAGTSRTPGTAPATGRAVVGAGRDHPGGGRVRRVAVRRELPADHRAPRSRHLLAVRRLDRRARLDPHPAVAGRPSAARTRASHSAASASSRSGQRWCRSSWRGCR